MASLESVCAVANAAAAESERRRALAPEVFDEMVATGVLKAWVPPAYGGAGATVAEGLDQITAVSRADGAAGWCVMIANTTALAAYYLPAEFAEVIFGPSGACAGGFGMPAGVGVVDHDGLRVSGTWPWGSGTDHCTWIGGGVRVVDEVGEPTQTADGSRFPFVFFARDEVELADNWHVSGLRGTASGDYRVDDVLVPEGRWCQFVGGSPVIEATIAEFSFFGALAAGTAAVTIGLAQRAIDELIALGEKVPAGSSRPLAARATTQAELASAQVSVGQAHAYLHAVVGRAWRSAEAGHPLDDETKVALRLAASGAAMRSVEAVDGCYHAAGGAAIFDSNPLQRVFRDVHVAVQHGMIAPRTLEPLGRFGFGLPTSTDTL